jgi:hypothetical protein
LKTLPYFSNKFANDFIKNVLLNIFNQKILVRHISTKALFYSILGLKILPLTQCAIVHAIVVYLRGPCHTVGLASIRASPCISPSSFLNIMLYFFSTGDESSLPMKHSKKLLYQNF